LNWACHPGVAERRAESLRHQLSRMIKTEALPNSAFYTYAINITDKRFQHENVYQW
jgi:hypothetical protein